MQYTQAQQAGSVVWQWVIGLDMGSTQKPTNSVVITQKQNWIMA